LKKTVRFHFRFIFLISVFTLICLLFVGRIVYLKINAPEIQASSDLSVRTLKIKAMRGEIFDRNGNKLVANDYTYSVYLDAGGFPKTNKEINLTLSKLSNALKNTVNLSYFPVEEKNGEYFYKKMAQDSAEYKAFLKMLDRYELPRSTECEALLTALSKRFELLDKNGKMTVDNADYIPVMALRYEMDRQSFSTLNPFTVANELTMEQITRIEELSLDGVEIEKSAKRIYLYPGYASHILGRTGKIPAEELEYYTEKGYPMNAIVGVDGAEKAFEEYLCGKDGTLVIVEDKDGNIVDEYCKTEPIAGKDVYLTIDIDLQKASEESLSYNIAYIKDKAEKTILEEKEKYTDEDGNITDPTKIPQYIGEDASSGAFTLVDPNTGEVLALASNPTFDLSSYLGNYNQLLEAENQPLFNRALMGNYEPGSTFKISVAAAALEYGIINRDTTIFDSGVYKFYDDFQPQCWLYTSYGYGHGNMNVVSAIQHSCNYFFYDVGRMLTIEKMNQYCKQLGLGEYTGIELPESKGVLAGPAYSASVNKTWVLGDTIQAAIGQSDNTFTPLQISMYLSTVINGGKRYQAHLLHSVREFGTGKVIYSFSPSVVGQAPISESTLDALMTGMKNVMENGTAAPVFADYPIDVGGKTGTAQVGKNKSNNGIFMAFAPFDKPEIVASCIIEQAGDSNNVGITVRNIFNRYFNISYPPAAE